MIQGRYRKEEVDASYSLGSKFIETGDYIQEKQNNNQSSPLTTFQSKVQSLFFFPLFHHRKKNLLSKQLFESTATRQTALFGLVIVIFINVVCVQS